MRHALVVVVVGLCASVAFGSAEGKGASIEWAHWRLYTGEPLVEHKDRVPHPLTYLLDDNCNTAWVFHGTSHPNSSGSWNPYFICLNKGWRYEQDALRADELWFMNGFSKSEELFRRNNRVVEVQLVIDEKPVRKVALTDRMGWHKISLPKRSMRSLKIEFTKFVKGPDDDVCSSGIMLFNEGKQVDLKVPPYVLYDPGSDCVCGNSGGYIMSRTGRLGEYVGGGETEDPIWSPNGRYAAYVDTEYLRDPQTHTLRVWDMYAPKPICGKALPDPGHDRHWDFQWGDDRRIEAYVYESGPGRRIAKRMVVRVR